MDRIILDTETTGLSLDGKIVQLSYINLDKQQAKNFFFSIPESMGNATAVHGFTNAELRRLSNGREFSSHMDEIKRDLDHNIIVAHNIEFDLGFLSKEALGCGKNIVPGERFCTMRYMTNIMQLPNQFESKFKYPKNREMREYFNVTHEDVSKKTTELFKVKGIGPHDSRYDASGLLLCYMKILDIIRQKTESTTLGKAEARRSRVQEAQKNL